MVLEVEVNGRADAIVTFNRRDSGRRRNGLVLKSCCPVRRRVRFEVAGGNYRLIAALDFRRQIVFVKFVGWHAEYDAIDALTVAKF